MAQQEEAKVEEVQDKGPRVYVSGTFECLSKDTIETFKTLFRPIVAITNKEKGCIQYNLHQDSKNELIFSIFEEWECQADLSAHAKGAHLAPIRTEKFKKIAKSKVRLSTVFISNFPRQWQDMDHLEHIALFPHVIFSCTFAMHRPLEERVI